MLRGCGTALVTPFRETGEVDETALRSLVDWQIEQGIDFLVPAGSTGEAATLSFEEHERVVAITVDQAAGRVPVVGGAGSNNTAEAIELSLRIAATGVTHLMHVSPPYNRPQQRGLIEHFTAVADAAPCPVVLYNVPGRTGSNIAAATTLALAAHLQHRGDQGGRGQLRPGRGDRPRQASRIRAAVGRRFHDGAVHGAGSRRRDLGWSATPPRAPWRSWWERCRAAICSARGPCTTASPTGWGSRSWSRTRCRSRRRSG